MSTLLLELQGSRTFNRTIFAPHLYVYDDLIIYRKRRFFTVREITVSYSQVAQVILTRGIIFGSIEIVTTGADNILIRYISKDKARQAKSFMDQKIFLAYAKHHPDTSPTKDLVQNVEKTLNRLKELLSKGAINQKEYLKKKDELLRKLK